MEFLIELLFHNRKAIKKAAKKHPELVSLGWLGIGTIGLYKALTSNRKPLLSPLRLIVGERQEGEIMTEWRPVFPLTRTIPMDETRVYRSAERLAH